MANSWPQVDPDIAAVESRGHLVYFVPSHKEMHQFAGAFCPDGEVYKFIGDHLDYFDRLDLRLYFKACQFKATGLRKRDAEVWKRYVRGQMMDDDKRVALNLMNDDTFASDNQRAKEYSRITGLSDRTFSRHRLGIRLRSGQVA